MPKTIGRKLKSSSLILLVLLSLFNNALSDQVFSTGAGEAFRWTGTFGRSYHEPKYKIEFHSSESPYHPDDNQEPLMMSLRNGNRFVCYLPKEEKAITPKLFSQLNTTNLFMETEKEISFKTPDELLEVLKDKCFHRQEGWWSYELCYQKKLRQVHVKEDKVVQEFILGYYDEDATIAFNQNNSDVPILKDPRSKDASQRYHAHLYTKGTICDLTNQPRETEVRFVCSERVASIVSVAELSTCTYAVTLHNPMLCKHPMFQVERPVWHTIDCNELPGGSKPTETGKRSFTAEEATRIPDAKRPFNYDSADQAT